MASLGKGIAAVTALIALGMCLSAPRAEGDDTGFEKMPPPQPGDWLAVRKERGQTFEQYKAECRNRKTQGRNVIYIQPFGDVARTRSDLIAALRDYLGIFFDCRVVVLDPIPLPEKALNPKPPFGEDQYDADYLLRMLQPRVPADAVALAGITDQDLFCEGMNFVFGLGSDAARSGVYSIRRYSAAYPGRPKDCTLLKRTLKVASHEIGHIFSMAHCIAYRCIMNGSNSLPEADRRPIHLCPICLRKLEWNTGVNRLERYRKLEDFYSRMGFEADADFVAGQIARMGRQGE